MLQATGTARKEARAICRKFVTRRKAVDYCRAKTLPPGGFPSGSNVC
jgi:hypothetical protein